MPVTNVGKISGQLLKANLTRTSDLLIDNTQTTSTPTLFIGHTNNRIGIKTDSPTRELLVNGDTKIAGDSIQTNSMTVGNLTFNGVTSTVTASVGKINLNSSGSHVFSELRTDNLAFTNSGIRSLGGSDIMIYPGPGTGKFIIPTDLKSYGGIHATGDITFDGSVFLGGDGSEDSLTIGADIHSNLIPDVTGTYDLGETGKRWGDVRLASMPGLNDVTIDNTISLAGVAVNLGIQNKWYVSTNGADNLAGNHPNFAFGSIKHALSYIQESSGGPHQLHILPGTYIEDFPLEIPENVSIKGSGIRSCIIKPRVQYRGNDAFIMNNATMVSEVTITDFQYVPAEDKGYAFRFSTNAGIVSKSPYVQNVTVLTHGETTSASDPRGFASGDAGKGALLDANVLDTASPRASMLFNGVTFITPGVDAVTVKNGSRIEFIDCFTYFANRGLYMQHSLNQYTPSAGSYNPVTGDMSLTVGSHTMRVGETVTIADNSLTFTCAQDNHQTDHTYPRSTDPYSGKKVTITATTATGFTCNVGTSSNVTAHLFKSATSNAVSEGTMNEARVIASATIYGNKGVVADGNGCLAYLISHNFAYVGTGKNVENETDQINQENEVEALNNAKVHFVSQDQDGDFRVGDNFVVDLGKGTTTIDVTGLDLTGSTLTVGTPGSTTLISATGIDVPNFRISNNTVSTLDNGLTIDSSGTTNITANANMQANVTVSGDATIAGSGINFGDAPGDTINFSMDFTDNLLPSTTTLSNLGSAIRQWRSAQFETANIDGKILRTQSEFYQDISFSYKIGNSILKQTICLNSSSKRLDFNTTVHWKEKFKMLRVHFPINIRSDQASFDIQYGYVKRNTHRNTSWDKAKFEVVGHHYADLSDLDNGVALMNDCKYGYMVHDNILDLNLLRSPNNPDPDADMGDHSFTYSFFPHRNDLVNSDVMPESARLNQPPLVFEGVKSKNKTPLTLEGDGLELTVLKKAEKTNHLVFRVVERLGRKTSGYIHLNGKLTECDLIEWNKSKEQVNVKQKLKLNFKPFEIKTFLFENSY